MQVWPGQFIAVAVGIASRADAPTLDGADTQAIGVGMFLHLIHTANLHDQARHGSSRKDNGSLGIAADRTAGERIGFNSANFRASLPPRQM